MSKIKYFKSFGLKDKNGKIQSVRFYRKYRQTKERVYYDTFVVSKSRCELQVGASTFTWMAFNNSWEHETTKAEYDKALKKLLKKQKQLILELK